jgi:hypothetical protein
MIVVWFTREVYQTDPDEVLRDARAQSRARQIAADRELLWTIEQAEDYVDLGVFADSERMAGCLVQMAEEGLGSRAVWVDTPEEVALVAGFPGGWDVGEPEEGHIEHMADAVRDEARAA